MDEWGTWFECEPGTNPGFLYQQNTMRDAIITAIILNIFNSHADRLVMANIAQIVNVLQAMVLTDGEEMLLTPTYHVFEMYKGHMDAHLLPTSVDCARISAVPQITASASVKDGAITLTVANTSCTDEETVDILLPGAAQKQVSARILTGDMHDHNTFEQKEKVKPEAYTSFTQTATGLTAQLPACSLVSFTLKD